VVVFDSAKIQLFPFLSRYFYNFFHFLEAIFTTFSIFGRAYLQLFPIEFLHKSYGLAEAATYFMLLSL